MDELAATPEVPAEPPAPALPVVAVEPERKPRPWVAPLLGYLSVAAASILFRLPLLLNAGALNSDGAVVGLQARHFLQGEWARFLWGAGYQAAIDSLVASGAFALFGSSAFSLVLVALLGHLAVCFFTYDIVRKRLGPWGGALACVPIIFVPIGINLLMHYIARQWCIAVVFFAFWLLDGGGSRAWHSWVRLGLGTFLAIFALFLDLYALLFLPALGLMAYFASVEELFDPARKLATWLRVLGRLSLVFVTALLGRYAVDFLRGDPNANADKATTAYDRVDFNLQLLKETCLPTLLGTKVQIPTDGISWTVWEAPRWWTWVQTLGAGSLLAFITFGAVAYFLWKWLDFKTRRLSVVGLATCCTTIAAFLISTMPSDFMSSRYLAPILWTAPFGLVALGKLLKPRFFAVALLPYAAVALVAGWLTYGSMASGPLPARTPRGVASEEQALKEALQARGVKVAVGNYWLSYRLTFLWNEEVIVVPDNPGQDRYPPYRVPANSEPLIAYLYHPSEPRSGPPEGAEMQLQRMGAKFEKLQVGGFTAFIHDRTR